MSEPLPQRIVYNSRFGGFSLSREAVLRAREISGNPHWGGATIFGDVNEDGSLVTHDYGYVDNVSRSDPILVQVVEELGDRANGECAQLAIKDLPPGTKYRIDEYDGTEFVVTQVEEPTR